MDILINVVGQQLKTVTNLKSVVSGTQNFVRFQFDLDEDWDGLLVYAQFIQNNALLTPVYLDEKKSCYLPPEVHSGKCQLALYGVGNKTISGSRQAVIGTTNYLVLDVIDNVLRGDPSHEEFTPTQYQQLLQRISNIETIANANSSRINSLTDSKVNQSDFNTFANNINQSISQETARAMAKENDLELNKVGFSNLAETNRNLMAEVERATTAETNLNSNKLDKSEFNIFVQDNTPNSGNYGELVDRVEYLENNPASPETIESSVTNWLNQHPEATTTVADGTITEAKLSTSVNESLAKADNSWQKSTSETDTPTEGSWESVYDPDGHGAEGVDPYSYAEDQGVDAIARMRGIIADNIDDGNQIFTVTDSDSTDHTYTGVDAALAGVYSLANDYVDGQLANYNSINIVVDPEDWPLVTGEPNTFYLIPKGNGKYEKWWYITDENDTPTWDNFGSSSTEVVSELPLAPDEDIDYILEDDGQYYYYKYIDNEWVLISGGGSGSGSESAQIIQREYTIDYFQHGTPNDNEITASQTTVGKYYLDLDTMDVYGGNITTDNTDPENPVTVYGWELIETLVAEPSVDIAYYCQFGNDTNLIQFRYVDDEFIMVGDVLEKNPVFNALSQAVTTNAANIARNASDITTNAGNLTSLSQTVSTLMDTLNNLDTEGYTYDISLDEAEDSQGNTRYRLTLLETKDNVETPKTYVFLPEGTGGGGGQVTTSILRVDKITSSPVIATTSDSIVIEINYSSTSPVDDQGQFEEYDGTYVWKSDGNTILSGNLVQGRNTFDLTEYCFTGTQKLTLTVTDETGNMSVKSWTVQIVNVRIETAFNDRFTQPIGRPVNFTYTPYGAISKTVHFKLDGVELESVSTTASSTLQSYTIPAQSHGSHLLEVWMTATVNNTNIETNHIYKDIIWYDEANNNPVIGCIYRYDYYGQVTARQYDTTAIVYNVFDPSTNYPIVKRYVDNVLISTETMESSNAIWNYKSETVGTHTLRIECRNTSVTIVMNITELGIDVDPITGGLEIDFNPIGITNNSSNRIWHNDNYHMSVSSNFDWANGGYRTDENGDTYFLVKAGTTASFDYEMFAGNPSNNVSNTGAEMKIVFMTENVQDASAVWFSNVETISTTVDNTTVTTNMGIEMSVHNGWLKTNKASTTDVEMGEGESVESVAATNTYLYMPYSEEDIIEMDINIDMLDTENANAQAFVMSYEDGVPAKAYLYDSSDRFYQYTPQPITIGSNYCDVRIYRLKIYSSSLTTEGIMKNFIADSRDSTTMLDRYDRNSIYYDREHRVYTPYSTQGSLDPERLAPTIPNVKVLMLETDHFTTSKKTFVKSSLRCIHAPGGDLYVGDPYYDNWYFENGYHAGQGTTSDNYGNSGRNVDFLFNCDGTHKPSDKVNAEAGYVSQVTLGYRTENAHTEVCTDWKGDTGKITLTRTSVPNNFFNLKVNIASSENANNALMQKRYSDFLPYISPAKQRDSRIKNDMEFVPAVLFIKETNPDMSVHTEFLDNEWHFYALGNIGDSKKTDYTRSYDPTDMNEFTIEISDNTKNNATFQTGVYRKPNGTLDYEHFHLVKTLDKEGELIVTPVSETTIPEHVYPVPPAQADTLLFQTGTIVVDNQTGDPQYDGNETGYLNMRMWCLYNEGFDGDHSFEPRYACCGDYRDGKLVNDYSGYGKQQVKTNEKVWRAFYKWVITSTDEQFVNELDQWCVRDAVEFFYAFTLYYTMMDNRAKNTFWHYAKTGVYREVSRPVPELLHIYEEIVNDEYVPTEDAEINPNKTYYTQYAFDQWGYDMDTAIGINNNGELTFPYGKEDTDFNIDGVPSSGYVFNGATSAFWCRLRDLLPREISNTFNTVQAECFSATNLINQFDNFQACYPEEIWRLDVERKYIRTFTGNSMDNSKPKKDSQYLRDMMQGRKKYQRRQWVRSQELYYGTKYLINNVVGDHNRILIRCYDPGNDVVVPKNYFVSITPYQDMYVSAMFGNGNTVQTRAKAGEPVSINFYDSTANDTQVTIYGASGVAALNDLSACYITNGSNFSMATRLRKLVIGNPTSGYANTNLTSLDVSDLKLLEELDIRNVINLSGALNLVRCSNLLKLYAEGTRITSATFATNGKVQIIHLPNTINTLEMRNLNNLSDFQCGLDYLERLTLQGGTLDNYALVSDTIDTLQVVYLYDVNWSVPNTNVLNALINAYSQLTGSVYISGTTRLNEIATYQQAWPDLVVTYDPENLRQQFLATYVNTDGTVLYQAYVDEGDYAPDPVATGAIDAPTRPSDQQYTYTYSGWDTLEGRMYADREIVATYSLDTRTYSVKWYGKHHNLLASREVPYGSEVNYGDVLPVYTDDEVYSIYNVFAGWDKSTGYIREDTEVNAIWETKRPPANTTSLNDMSAAEIYAISQEANRIVGPTPISSYTNITEGSYIDITMGNDFNFTNVESELLCENQFFDGTNYLDTGIKLFDVNSPSFTLAIDYEFYDVSSTDSVLVSCVNGMQNQMNSGGFRIFYSGSPYISFQGSDQRCGCSYYRNMLVIRHQKGSGILYMYASNASSESNPVYSDNIMQTTFGNVSSTLLTNDYTLVFGANKVVNDYGNTTYINRGSGWINWCKIWYDDLGENNARELAQWPHETWRAQFSGSERYQMMDGRYAQLTFILNHTLSLPHVVNQSSSSSGGWQNMSIRSFLNDRMYKAFPVEWRSMLKRVSVRSNTGYGSSTVEASYDYVFLPAVVEINGTTVEPYRREGTLIPFFSDEFYRYRFSDLYRLNNSRTDNNGSLIQPPTYSGTTEPTTSVSNHVQKGDIWVRYMNANNHAFYYIPPNDDDIKHYRYVSDSENVMASDGGIWVRAKIYWTRTPYTSYTYTNYAINTRGSTLNAGVNTSYYLTPCFAV